VGRHASWLELFFDLVIVAAVAQLAHLLHEPDLEKVFLFAVFYYCIWSVWTAFTLYANVEGDKTHRRTMLFAMFGIAVMAATIPRAAEGQSDPFVLAFVVCRVMAGRTWDLSGKVMTSWISAQTTYSFIPWVLSLWAEGKVKYGLWAFAIVLDIVLSAYRARDPQRLIQDQQRKFDRHNELEQRRIEKTQERGRPRRSHLYDSKISDARVDAPHFSERLGLFVIIVLGEAVAQVVMMASGEESSRRLWLVGLAGFGLLVSLWWLTLEYGVSIAPTNTALPPKIALPTHFVMTAAIVAIAAGLGALTEHAESTMPSGVRWVLCGGAAAYFLTTAIVGVYAKAPRVWLLGWALPAIVVCVLLGVFGGHVLAPVLAIGVLAVADWYVLYPKVTGRARPQDHDTAAAAAVS
jgi:low temperature requirement protein LtrA